MIDGRHIGRARWDILRTVLCGGRPGATEPMLACVLGRAYAGATREAIRGELDYLERRGLVRAERAPIRPWRVRLTRRGRALAVYARDAEAGIRRPPPPPS